MFGLTQREQRWAAEERGFKMILEAVQSKTQLRLLELENENLRLKRDIAELNARYNKG